MEPIILHQRYRLEETARAGGMATVYRGHDTLLDRPIAVKILREPYASDPAFRERFVQEARAAARLDHPNVVHIYDVGEDDEGHPYIVMELVKGENLKSLIRRERPLSVTRALNLTRQICTGVGHAHRSGLVHCDLKPHNILLTPSGQIKVTDFGIARAFNFQEEPAEPVAKEKFVWGSPHYISPEQASGDPPTPASDVYSIGIILYEMLTGVPPFHSQDPAELALKHLRESPPPLTSLNPRIPPKLEWLVHKVLSKEPANRYRNADQLGIAIEEYTRQGDEQTLPHSAVSTDVPAPSDIQTIQPAASVASALELDPSRDTKPMQSRGGIDWLMWGLLLVATVAVLGLVPLWNHVIQTWGQPELPNPPIVDENSETPTPEAQLVTVPQIIGLGAPDAQRLVEGLQLQLSVLGEQETSDARPGTVLEQDPSAGSRVVAGTTVKVILAKGHVFNLPDVLGYQLEVIRDGLESEGLLVKVIEMGDQQPAGTILEQEPPANSEIRAGSTVTLTVSGGPEYPIPLEVNLNNMIMLEEAQFSQGNFRPGEGLGIKLRWRCIQPIDQSYKVFVHLISQDMQTLVTQQDVEPVNGLRPTTTWTPGEIILDPHQLTVPQGTLPGTYQIRVGLYNADGRLPVVDVGKTEVTAHSIFIADVEIRP